MMTDVHKWTGLATFSILLVVAITGCVLTFRDPLDALLNPDLFRAPASARSLPLSALIDAAQRQRPEARVVQAPAMSQAGQSLVLEVAPRRRDASLGYNQLFVDPADGKVLGDRQSSAGWDRRHLLQGIYDIHVRLMAGAPGRIALGIVAGAWLTSNFIGAYLTMPRGRPFLRRWRPLWTVQWRAKTPRLMLDLHRASGLWFFLGVTALAATGFFLNFYTEVSEPIAHVLSPPRFNEPPARRPGAAAPNINYDTAVRIARRHMVQDDRALTFTTASFDPEQNLYRIGFTRSGRLDFRGLGPVYDYVDAQTGRVTARDDPYRDSAGRAFLRALYTVHSGRFLGWPTRLLIFASGLATAAMAVSGVYLWLRKRKAAKLAA
jgi:uncharacterized iron-regulated membrane protein